MGLCDRCLALLEVRRAAGIAFRRVVESLAAAFGYVMEVAVEAIKNFQQAWAADGELRRLIDEINGPPPPVRPAPGRQPSFRGRDRRHTRGGFRP